MLKLGAGYTSKPDESFWSDVYQEASSRISMDGKQSQKNDSVLVTILPKVKFQPAQSDKVEEEEEGQNSKQSSTKKKYSKIKFECQSVLQGGQETNIDDDKPKLEELTSSEEGEKNKKKKKMKKRSESLYKQPLHSLSDSNLLDLGAGRTGHPAARFGIKCSGKLSRAADFV